MPEYQSKEMATRPVEQVFNMGDTEPGVNETDCLDTRQAPTVWYVVEGEMSAGLNLWQLRQSQTPGAQRDSDMPETTVKQSLPTFFSLPLQPGHQVYCRDGYAGKITALHLNPPDSIHSFVMETGRFFRSRVIVPYEWVERIETDSLYLSAEKGDLKLLPEVRSDSILILEVERALWEDAVLRTNIGSIIHVSATNGVIGLEGYVSNTAQKTHAGEAASRVPGVLAVQNCLVVDEDLKMAAARAVGEAPLSHNERIFVGAQNGFIILNGEVSTVKARITAEERAGEVPRIRGVINSIRVAGAEIDLDEPRAIQPRIGVEVYARDMALGFVERVVLHPVNRLVTAIVVNGRFPDPKATQTGWFPDEGAMVHRKVVIPVRAIRHLTNTALFLEIKSREAANFEDFDTADFALPEASWRPPYPYLREHVLLWNSSTADARSESVLTQSELQEV